MTAIREVYKCDVCGNICQVHHAGAGQLVCCGKPMGHLQEKTADEGQEKHVPVIEKREGKTLVKVGSEPHPMETSHYIEWIEVATEKESVIHFLKAGEMPEATFAISEEDVEYARIYCNIHGLWRSK